MAQTGADLVEYVERHLLAVEAGDDIGANLPRALARLFSTVDDGVLPAIDAADASRLHALLAHVCPIVVEHFRDRIPADEISLGLRAAVGIVQIAAGLADPAELANHADLVAITCMTAYAANRQARLMARLKTSHPEIFHVDLIGPAAGSGAFH